MKQIFPLILFSVLINVVVTFSLASRLNVQMEKTDNFTIDTINEALNSLTIDKNSLYNSFVTSNERVRNIILKQSIKPERRNFLGLIIIPCKLFIIH